MEKKIMCFFKQPEGVQLKKLSLEEMRALSVKVRKRKRQLDEYERELENLLLIKSFA